VDEKFNTAWRTKKVFMMNNA